MSGPQYHIAGDQGHISQYAVQTHNHIIINNYLLSFVVIIKNKYEN